MSSRVERAVGRLKRLAAKSSDGDSAMSVIHDRGCGRARL